MLDAHDLAAWRQENPDRVEADRAPSPSRSVLPGAEPYAGHAPDLVALGRPDRLEGRDGARRRSARPRDERLHLAEDKRAVPPGDQVELPLARTEVALEDRVTEALEELRGDHLAALTGAASRVRGHPAHGRGRVHTEQAQFVPDR